MESAFSQTDWGTGYDVPLSQQEFDLLRELAHRQAGIHLGPHKKEMLKARLLKRLRTLGFKSFLEYYSHLQHRDDAGDERVQFVNALTTNVTEFFREEHHFRFLREQWLPSLRAGATSNRLRIWSAGCSTGEEPYSIAMAVREGLGPACPAWDVRILASDIDSDALQRAADGIYPQEKLAQVPVPLHARYFLCGTGKFTGKVRVRPQLQEWLTFRRMSLVEPAWPIYTRFDAIFCRNVLIYFNRADQERVLKRLLEYLDDSGLLFLGHSEGVHGMNCGLHPVGPTTYRRGRPSADAVAPRGERK
jgi:chemotaxis protein methyltransferase CheR